MSLLHICVVAFKYLRKDRTLSVSSCAQRYCMGDSLYLVPVPKTDRSVQVEQKIKQIQRIEMR